MSETSETTPARETDSSPAAETAPESPETEATETEATETEAAETEATETEAAETETAETETAETEATETEATETETAETEATETEAAETETAETETAETEATKTEAAATETAETETSETETAETETVEAEAAGAGTAETDSGDSSAAELAFDSSSTVEGKVIGWNKGGFHVVVDGITAFCPRSEMEIGKPAEPKGYVDQTLEFKVLEVRRGGSRVVLSRAAALKGASDDSTEKARPASGKLEVGAVVRGTVVSITDFGAFVELGGVQGLVHISELSRRHVAHPSDVVSEGDDIEVKILKIERGGRRISLSRKALEPDPWADIKKRLGEGAEVKGVVEKTERFGALIEIEPGLTGLLPTSQMSLPRDTSPVRAFPPGREVEVQIVSIDPRRRRISLAPKGARTGGSRADIEEYKRSEEADGGFNALEAAFRKARTEP